MKRPSGGDQYRRDEASLPSEGSFLLWTVLCLLSRTAPPSSPAGTACRGGWNVPPGKGIEHLLYKKWIHPQGIREFIEAKQVESRIVHELAIQPLSIGIPVEPQELVIEHGK